MNLSTLITRVKSTAAASPFVWRWGLNFSRTAHHMLDEPLTASEVETLNVLRSEGIIVCAAQELFGDTGIQLLDRIGKEVDGLVEKQRALMVYFWDTSGCRSQDLTSNKG